MKAYCSHVLWDNSKQPVKQITGVSELEEKKGWLQFQLKRSDIWNTWESSPLSLQQQQQKAVKTENQQLFLGSSENKGN